MNTKARARFAIAVLGGLWLAALAADRWVRPQPGLEIAEVRAGELVRSTVGTLPLEPSLVEVEQRLGDGFEIRYSGWIRIQHAGVYHASIEADRASTVRLDVRRQPFVGANAGDPYPIQAFREFQPGLHSFELRIQHGGSRRATGSARPAVPELRVTWSKGIALAQPVPADAVFPPETSPWQFRLSAWLRMSLVFCSVAIAFAVLALVGGSAIARALGIRLAAVAVGLLVSIGLAEGGLRLLGIEQREYVPGTIWLTYEYPKPNTTTQYVGYLPYLVKEFDVPVHINSRGWRDREFDYAKPPGVYRIVVVGDSYVEGKEVLLEHTFHKRLEARLNEELAHPGLRFEVVALARGGISTDMELRVIQERATRYAPDLVVLAFYAGNDVRGNLPSLESDYNRWANEIYGAKVVPARIACTDALTWSKSSRLNNVLTARLCDLYIAHLHEFRDDLDAEDMISPDGAVFRQPYDTRWREAWRVTGDLIRKSQRASEEMGASFLMLMIHSSQLAGVAGGALASDEQQFDIDKPFEILHGICSDAKIDCLDLRPPLERFAAETGLPYCWRHDAHWNENGHRVTADALFERLSASFSSP